MRNLNAWREKNRDRVLDLPVSRILTVQVVVQLVLSGSLISANLYVFLFFFFFFETRFFEEEKDAMDRLNSF